MKKILVSLNVSLLRVSVGVSIFSPIVPLASCSASKSSSLEDGPLKVQSSNVDVIEAIYLKAAAL